jgi:hypothetical protein
MEPTTCGLFKLDPPSNYVAPPESALRRAKVGIADFLRASPLPIATQQLIIGAAARVPFLAEGDLAWAIHHLAHGDLLEVGPPPDWSPQFNVYGYVSQLVRQSAGQCIQQTMVELPFDKGIVAATEALWTWRRENDSPSHVGAGNPGPRGWSKADSPSRWEKVFDCSWKTLARRIQDGKIRCLRLSTKSYKIAIDDIPPPHQAKYLPNHTDRPITRPSNAVMRRPSPSQRQD